MSKESKIVSFQVYKPNAKVPFRTINFNLSDFPQKLIDKMPHIFKYGWKLVQYHECNPNNFSLGPPGYYECLGWGSESEFIKVGNLYIDFNDFLFEEGIIQTGTRSEDCYCYKDITHGSARNLCTVCTKHFFCGNCGGQCATCFRKVCDSCSGFVGSGNHYFRCDKCQNNL
jgi:hypothetical protein